MKKKIIKLIFDIMISLAGLVGAWNCMAQGFEYLFIAEDPDMAAFKICSSILILIATALLIFIIIPLEIEKIQEIKRKKKIVKQSNKARRGKIAVIGTCRNVRQFILAHNNDTKNYIKVSREDDAFGRRFTDYIIVGNPELIPSSVIEAVKDRLIFKKGINLDTF